MLDEAVLDKMEDGFKPIWVFDNQVKVEPDQPRHIPAADDRDYSQVGGHFGPHNIHENRPGSFQSSELIFATYQNAGVRVYDIRNQYQPVEVGACVPPAPKKLIDPRPNRPVVLHSADVFVDRNGICLLHRLERRRVVHHGIHGVAGRKDPSASSHKGRRCSKLPLPLWERVGVRGRLRVELHLPPDLLVFLAIVVLRVVGVLVAAVLVDVRLDKQMRRGDEAAGRLAGEGAVQLVHRLPAVQAQRLGDRADRYSPARMRWNAGSEPSPAEIACGGASPAMPADCNDGAMKSNVRSLIDSPYVHFVP